MTTVLPARFLREDTLITMVLPHAALRDVRMARDKITGEPRGFAFVHLHSVAAAARVMLCLQARSMPKRLACCSWCALRTSHCCRFEPRVLHARGAC